MKENSNKDIELVRKLSQLMSKENITKLKYEKSDLKLSNNKNAQFENSTATQTPKLVEAETKNTHVESSRTGYSQRLRSDKEVRAVNRIELQDCAPEISEGFYKVPRIID